MSEELDEKSDFSDSVKAPKKPTKRPSAWAILAGVAGILIIGGGAIYAMTKEIKVTVTSKTVTSTPATTTTSSPSSTTTAATVTPVTDDGVTWLNPPQKLAALHLFKNLDKYFQYLTEGKANPEDNITYLKVGTDHGHFIVYADVAAVDPGGDQIVAFIATDATHYKVLRSCSSDFSGYDSNVDYMGPDLADGITIDTTTTYKSLANQTTLTTNGLTFTQVPTKNNLPPELLDTNATHLIGNKYAETAYGSLYRENPAAAPIPANESTNNAPIVLDVLYLQRPDSTVGAYQLAEPTFFIGGDMVPNILWADGTKNKDTYRDDGGGGCGSVNGVAIPAASDISNDITAIGKTSTNETIYGFKSIDNNIVTAYYNEYAEDFSKSIDATNAANSPKIVYRDDVVSKTDYINKYHALFVYKDALNRNIIFSSTVYGSASECGKPVIYLYPTQPTNVSVTVGANVTKSEPAYNTGWNVLAQPNGKLTTANGQQYGSLFWEGLGKGAYPTIQSGFIVQQAKLHTTLVSQLTQLGLNSQEQADFLAFWEPKLPSTPYVRLTWFGTQQMNELAPLTVSPRPDTTIRVFLDFAGLDQPITLKPQVLSSVPRKGFTLVEWGGLLKSANSF